MAYFHDPRKQRTRQHVIADLGVHFVEGCILEAGHTAQRSSSDYGYDLFMNTFDEAGYVEPGVLCFQVKATESLAESRGHYVHDLDIRDYHLWMAEELPVILILFDASRRRAYWLAIQEYFQADALRAPKRGARTVRVHVPKRQAVNRRAIGAIREMKGPAYQRILWGERRHETK